jgi:hypothetical protein
MGTGVVGLISSALRAIISLVPVHCAASLPESGSGDGALLRYIFAVS